MSKRQIVPPTEPKHSVCMLCGADIAQHFDGDSWTGCSKPAGPMFIPPMMIVLSPDMLRFVAGAVEQAALPTAPPLPEPEPESPEPEPAPEPAPETVQEPAPRRRSTPRAPKAQPGDRRRRTDTKQPERRRATDVQPSVRPARERRGVSAEPEQQSTDNSEARGRGRIAGRYMLSTKPPSKVTESIEAVYKMVKTHKRGLTVKDIATRLKMPTGTVGWAVQKLVHQGAVQYQPPGA
jgi:hypothetical protein